MSRIFVSSTRKSSGKTMFTTGLCSALVKRGLTVQPFKKGPDYIDPMWLGRASERPCINLDFNTMSKNEILNSLGHYAEHSDINVIEGNKGLFDGVDPLGSDSNAALASLSQTPVIIVIDAEGITRGIAPLLKGYQNFDPAVQIAGVVLNNLGGKRHEMKLRDVISHYTDIEVLGGIQRNSNLAIPERHLGLVTDKETPKLHKVIAQLTSAIEGQVNIDRILDIACNAPKFPTSIGKVKVKPFCNIRLGIARDAAFSFYYEDDLETMRQFGVQVTFFSVLQDQTLPDVDALFLGGGFPETHCVLLEKNRAMKDAVRRFVDSGKPVYAECGGLMYLSRQIRWKNQCKKMVGAIPADTHVQDQPVGRGYVVLEPTPSHPWDMDLGCESTNGDNALIKAHEFHYSSLHNLSDNIQFAYKVKRGHGINGVYDGLVYKNIFASFAHMRNTKSNPWIKRFVSSIQNSG